VTTSRYADQPPGLLALDPQLTCYSWMCGIPDVALVVFVRKSHPEIQYLKATISEEQRREYGRLVETTIGQIESGEFPLRSGIRFPTERSTSCSHLGPCLGGSKSRVTNRRICICGTSICRNTTSGLPMRRRDRKTTTAAPGAEADRVFRLETERTKIELKSEIPG
jgi:hypothetical protein